MESKHTPGPWETSKVKGLHVTHIFKTMPCSTLIAQTEGLNNEADAHLIAAAPELLEALKELLAHEGERSYDNGIGYETDSIALEKAKNIARSAIDKAEGK